MRRFTESKFQIDIRPYYNKSMITCCSLNNNYFKKVNKIHLRFEQRDRYNRYTTLYIFQLFTIVKTKQSTVINLRHVEIVVLYINLITSSENTFFIF